MHVSSSCRGNVLRRINKPIATFGVLAVAWAAISHRWAAAAEGEDAAAEKITYADHVRPILREHCFLCHNQNRAQNDLKLDNYENLMAGGASGPAVEPGDAENSYLYMLVSHSEQPFMPPNADRLPDEKLSLIKRWIEGGALKDAGSTAAKPKNQMDLSPTAANQPEGTPIMPEDLPKTPVTTVARPGAVTAAASAPWAPLTAVAGQHQVVLYNNESGELLGILPFPEGTPHVIKFNRAGSILLVGGGKAALRGMVVLFDVKTGNRLAELGDELDVVLAADISPDNKLVALGGPQKIVRVYQTADGNEIYSIKKHTDWVTALEFSPDGVLLATADRSGGVSVWEADTGREYQTLAGHPAMVNDLSWRADSNLLATAGQDGTVRLWEMERGSQVRSINAHADGATAVEFFRDGRLATCGRDRLCKTWDAAGRQIRQFGPLPDLAMVVTVSHDSARLAAGDFAGDFILWKTEDGQELAKLATNPAAPQ